jgi:hypothetical protein
VHAPFVFLTTSPLTSSLTICWLTANLASMKSLRCRSSDASSGASSSSWRSLRNVSVMDQTPKGCVCE